MVLCSGSFFPRAKGGDDGINVKLNCVGRYSLTEEEGARRCSVLHVPCSVLRWDGMGWDGKDFYT
jgi:hypothetical protein